jgi:small subunit ribosomal protein S24e
VRLMEIEITSKKNNPLLNRTEVRFIVRHQNEKTPTRAIIRDELAGELNAKKEAVIVDELASHFGLQQTEGYAKVYTSMKKAEELEPKFLLKRNRIIAKKEKKEEAPVEEKPVAEPPAEAQEPSEKPKEENA